MALTDRQKERARHHLGYLGVSAASTFVLGIPAATNTQFMIEGAWDLILPESEERFELLLCQLDRVEKEAVEGGIDVATVVKSGSVEINPNRLRDLAKLYKIPQQSLSNMLGVIANPFDQRDWLRAGSGLNVSMSG